MLKTDAVVAVMVNVACFLTISLFISSSSIFTVKCECMEFRMWVFVFSSHFFFTFGRLDLGMVMGDHTKLYILLSSSFALHASIVDGSSHSMAAKLKQYNLFVFEHFSHIRNIFSVTYAHFSGSHKNG